MNMVLHTAVYVSFLSLSACLDGPNLFKQDGSAADSYSIFTNNDDGIVTGQFDPTSAAVQVMSASGDTGISGAKAAFPPGALAIDVMISMQEGSSIANAATISELNISGNLSSAGSAVVISNSLAIDATKEFSMSVPRSQGSSLALASSDDQIIVVYRVLKNGETFVGVIPNSELTVTGQSITFKTKYFGSYQAAVTDVKITKPREKATEAEILTSKDEKLLPPLKIIIGKSTSDDFERTIMWPIKVEGANELIRCAAMVHTDKNAAPSFVDSEDNKDELRKLTREGEIFHHRVKSNQAATYHYRFACTDITGRVNETQFFTAKIGAKPMTPTQPTTMVKFSGWLAPGTSYTQRLWDETSGLYTKLVEGVCTVGAGPVQIRIAGHDPSFNPVRHLAVLSCPSSGIFSFTLGFHTDVTDSQLVLPDVYGGFSIEAIQNGARAEAVVIKVNTSTPRYHNIATISTRSELAAIPTSGSGTIGKVYILTNHIDLGGCGTSTNWTPLANFRGILVGDLFSIKNLCIELGSGTQSAKGLFSEIVEATVSHLVFESPRIIVPNADTYNVSEVGIVAGIAQGSVNPSIVRNVLVRNALINLQNNPALNGIGSNNNIGGLVGYSYFQSYIRDVKFEGSILAPQNGNVGGIIGFAESSSIAHVFAGTGEKGVVEGKIYVGGLVGLMGNTNSSYYSLLSHSAVELEKIVVHGASSEAFAGGLVGMIDYGAVNTSRSRAAIHHVNPNINYSGGAVGKNNGIIENVSVETYIYAPSAIVGGLVGYQSGEPSTIISASYAVVDFEVTGSGSFCGGLVGLWQTDDVSLIKQSWAMPELVNSTNCDGNADALLGTTIANFIDIGPMNFYWYSSTFGAPTDHSASTPTALSTSVFQVSSPIDLYFPGHPVYSVYWNLSVWYFSPTLPPRLQLGLPQMNL